MSYYVVSYDLRREVTSKDYELMHETLKTASDYCWPLESFWIIETTYLPSEVITVLMQRGVIDDNDGIVVLEITGIGAFRRVVNRVTADWLNTRITQR
jgi:uncharacterized membrane protein